MADSRATFELFKDAEGKWRWHLVHDNGNIVADSGEGYTSKQNAEQGIESVKENAPGADVVEE
ncbi:MAG: HVO_2922 family protein [Halolamina sp.]